MNNIQKLNKKQKHELQQQKTQNQNQNTQIIQEKGSQQLNHKIKYMTLLKFLKSNGLKFKTAAFSTKSLQYFRMDQFRQLIQTKKNQIQNNFEIKQLLKDWQTIFLFYKRPSNMPKLKWPTCLQESSASLRSKFASFGFEEEYSYFTTFAIVLSIISLILYQLWPYTLKFYIYKILLFGTIFLIGLIFVRLILFLLMALFGMSFWILPKLFDNCSVRQSLKPCYKIQKWSDKEKYKTTLVRFIFLVFLIYYGYIIYEDPTIISDTLNSIFLLKKDIDTIYVCRLYLRTQKKKLQIGHYVKKLNESQSQIRGSNEDINIDGFQNNE